MGIPAKSNRRQIIHDRLREMRAGNGLDLKIERG
jgi:hypothetical protein